MLAEAGLSFQRTRTWKASPDPDYEAKAARILELRPRRRADGGRDRVRSDGPGQPAPDRRRRLGAAGPARAPARDYNRRHGIRYVFGAYDVHADRLRVRLRPRRRGSDMLAFMPQIRAAIPARQRIYWIQDNLSANWTPDIRAFAAANRIELVPTPTYASYLNPVECHFSPISEFVVNNADYLDWDAFAYALARHVQLPQRPPPRPSASAAEARHQIAA